MGPAPSMMSAFEIRANNILTVIQGARLRIENFGYKHDHAHEAVSAINGAFITWLVACEEARAQVRTSNPEATFLRDVIKCVPDNDDPSWPVFIEPKPTSSLRRRLEALWGIRVAYTHSDGSVGGITNSNSRSFAEHAPNHIEGVSLVADRLDISNCSLHVAIRSIVQVRSLLP